MRENHPVAVRVVDEGGDTVGTVRRDWALDPPPSLAPLEIATAKDFARPV